MIQKVGQSFWCLIQNLRPKLKRRTTKQKNHAKQNSKNKFGKSEITASVNSVKEINDSQEELDESFETARKNLKYFKSERNNLQRKWTLLVKEQNKLAKNIDFLCEQITNELEEINKKI